MKKQDALQLVFENPGRFGCTVLKEGQVLDAGIDAPGGWMAGRAVVQSLLGFAEVNFDQMTAGAHMVPTLDVYLDNTVAAARTLDFSGGVISGEGSDYGFVLTDSKNADPADKKVLLAGGASLVGHLFQAGTALPRAVQGLLAAGFCPEEIYWGHSAMPIILRHADAALEAAVQERVQKAGALVSVWARCSDEEMKTYLQSWNGPGELRLHNVLSGNTFIGGKIDEDALLACLV